MKFLGVGVENRFDGVRTRVQGLGFRVQGSVNFTSSGVKLHVDVDSFQETAKFPHPKGGGTPCMLQGFRIGRSGVGVSHQEKGYFRAGRSGCSPS